MEVLDIMVVATSRAHLNINTSQQSLFIDDHTKQLVYYRVYTTLSCLNNAQILY